MIINTKKESLNYVLLKRGGYKLFSHKLLNRPKLPLISSSYEKKLNILLSKPLINEQTNSQINRKYFKDSHINSNSTNNNPLNYDSRKIEESLIEKHPNSIQNNSIKSRNLGTSITFGDYFPNEKTLTQLSNNNCTTNENNLTLMTNLNIFNNIHNNYKNNIHTQDDQQFNDDALTNSTVSIDSYLKRKKNIKKQIEIKERILKLNEKKKFDFMKNILKDDKNFLIDDYLKNKIVSKSNRFLSCNNNNNSRYSFLNGQYKNIKKDGHPILIKDIKTKSLLNDYENKKLELLKLKPLILNENYLNNRYGKDMNKISGINDYELKINLKKNVKSHITIGNNVNIFDLTNNK